MKKNTKDLNREQAKKDTAISRKKLSFLSGVAAIVGLIGTIIAMVMAISSVTRDYKMKIMITERERYEIEKQLSSLGGKIQILEQNVAIANKHLDNLGELPQNAKVNLHISELQLEISRLDTNILRLNEVILKDPWKAVSIPLLEKEVDNLKNDLSEFRQELLEARGSEKWIIGLIFMVALTLWGTLTRIRPKNTGD